MIYIKVRNEWYTTHSSIQSSGELSTFTYGNCQLIYDDETGEVEAMAEFDTISGDWNNKNLDLSLEQIKLELFLHKEEFPEWSEKLDHNWPVWENYDAR